MKTVLLMRRTRTGTRTCSRKMTRKMSKTILLGSHFVVPAYCENKACVGWRHAYTVSCFVAVPMIRLLAVDETILPKRQRKIMAVKHCNTYKIAVLQDCNHPVINAANPAGIIITLTIKGPPSRNDSHNDNHTGRRSHNSRAKHSSRS